MQQVPIAGLAASTPMGPNHNTTDPYTTDVVQPQKLLRSQHVGHGQLQKLWFTGSAGQGNLPTAAKCFNLVGSSL
jgi:hypothetical protein